MLTSSLGIFLGQRQPPSTRLPASQHAAEEQGDRSVVAKPLRPPEGGDWDTNGGLTMVGYASSN